MDSYCVLLVEDDPNDAFFFKASLEAVRKCSVYLVPDARAAVAFLEAVEKEPDTKPDAIFIDLQLPAGSGAELLDRLCADPRFSGIPRYVLTGAEGAQSFGLPVRRTFAKPVSAAMLAGALASG